MASRYFARSAGSFQSSGCRFSFARPHSPRSSVHRHVRETALLEARQHDAHTPRAGLQLYAEVAQRPGVEGLVVGRHAGQRRHLQQVAGGAAGGEADDPVDRQSCEGCAGAARRRVGRARRAGSRSTAGPPRALRRRHGGGQAAHPPVGPRGRVGRVHRPVGLRGHHLPVAPACAPDVQPVQAVAAQVAEHRGVRVVDEVAQHGAAARTQHREAAPGEQLVVRGAVHSRVYLSAPSRASSVSSRCCSTLGSTGGGAGGGGIARFSTSAAAEATMPTQQRGAGRQAHVAHPGHAGGQRRGRGTGKRAWRPRRPGGRS